MRSLLWLVVAIAANALILPRILCDPAAHRWFDGDRETMMALADTVARHVLANPDPIYYRTGIDRFDGQSAVAIDQMALLGMGQIIARHPDLRPRYLDAMRAAADRLADPAQLTYARRRYGHNGVARTPASGHAYLGYVAMGLGMMRQVDPDTPHAALHDRMVAGLAKELLRAPTGMMETYPGETWPPDIAVVAGAIGLHATVTGRDRRGQLDAWAARFADCGVDPESGMLRQFLPRCGQGTARGSGTALAAYALSYATPDLARRLAAATPETGVLGFGALREYPHGVAGRGDINAGIVIAGVSVGATGFGLGAARSSGDRGQFVRLYRTTRLFGMSMPHGEERAFAVGGALGNALLLAMLTAPEAP